ncbi:hypothetical protein SAMN04487983_106221 [Streptomyces sp. yr375]|uniref:hypothetical protein n=1 Tax=Streptomyces sp. yr375 TaxID=1761906 RepID=UPI0008B4E7DC|nr:hypothetical protein [Streptomyces sp. yr375]SES47003.1 hypothetical protein SAMN04487983_106221 [Streptomyces sp. yr375]
MTTPRKPRPRPRTDAPFLVGDRVKGTTYVTPEGYRHERREPFEGVVVQVGSGYAGVDAEQAFVWVRLADHTERQALVVETELASEADDK